MLLVAVQHLELPQELDQRAFAKGVRDRRVERERGILRRQNLDPTRRDPRRDEVALVEQQHHVFVAGGGALEELLDVLDARADRVAHVQHLDHHVGGVDDFVELSPDALGLALVHDVFARCLGVLDAILEVRVLVLVIPLLRRLRLREQLAEVVSCEFGPLPLALLAEGLFERLHVQHAHWLRHGRVGEKRQRKLLSFQQHCVRIVHFVRELLPELG
mmetsp:Transcript_54940/g.129572  ORF Transcript_54940/g.129572 Transcript_54940/m.129572 type:complete len:217 (-) Transcript_54940:384-1034(-)